MQGDRTRCYVVNKEHMIVTKIIDLLVENVAHRAGFDLYRDGLNIVLGIYVRGPPRTCRLEQRREFLRLSPTWFGCLRQPTRRAFTSLQGCCFSSTQPQYREACEDFFVPIFAVAKRLLGTSSSRTINTHSTQSSPARFRSHTSGQGSIRMA